MSKDILGFFVEKKSLKEMRDEDSGVESRRSGFRGIE